VVHGAVRGWTERLHGTAGPDPCARTETEVMEAALADAGATASEVAYVNAHATGSVQGDLAETAAIGAVFGRGEQPWVNATKSITGHSLSAAGLVECVATLTQLGLGVLHPTVGLNSPESTDLRHPPIGTRIPSDAVALSNGYGFGGFNTTVVLAGAAA
jgi:malonyl-ACP decarboxylase